MPKTKHSARMVDWPSQASAIMDINNTTTFGIVSTTWFHGRIPGGAMLEGPQALIAFKAGYRPVWLKESIETSTIDCESVDDAKVVELKQLVEAGHARLIAGVGHIHTTRAVLVSLNPPDDPDRDSSSEAEEDGDESTKKQKTKA